MLSRIIFTFMAITVLVKPEHGITFLIFPTVMLGLLPYLIILYVNGKGMYKIL